MCLCTAQFAGCINKLITTVEAMCTFNYSIRLDTGIWYIGIISAEEWLLFHVIYFCNNIFNCLSYRSHYLLLVMSA